MLEEPTAMLVKESDNKKYFMRFPPPESPVSYLIDSSLLRRFHGAVTAEGAIDVSDYA